MTRRTLPMAAVLLALIPAAAQGAPLGDVAVRTANAVTRSTGDVPYLSSVRLTPGVAVVSSDYVSRRSKCPARLAGRPPWRASRGARSVSCVVRFRSRTWRLVAVYTVWPRRDRSRLTVTVRGS